MPGAKGRSGRKSKAEEMGLVALLNKCWTATDREKCIRSLAANANAGDMDSIKLLLSYTFGKPKETVDMKQSGHIEVVYVNDWRP